MGTHFNPRPRGFVAVRADASGDPKAIFAELQTAFAAFKTEHSEQLAEVKKGFDDVVKAEKVDRINAEVGTLQKAIDDLNAKMASASLGGSDQRIPNADYTKAFGAFFKNGDVQAALTEGTDSQGGYTAPKEWDRTITDKLVEVSPMRRIARVQSISTAGFSRLYNLRGTGSGWVGETAARPETTAPTFGSLTFTPGEIYANPAATQTLLDDSEVNLEAWLANEVETEFALQEGLAFISGNGTNKPAGFLTYATGGTNAATHPLGAIEVTTAASGSAIAYDDLVNLVYSAPAAYRGTSRFVMNSTTASVLRKLKDSNGLPLWQPSMQEGEPASILGYPVTDMPGMPDIALSAIPVAFGDFARGYLIVDRIGTRVLRDPYTNKPYVMFYVTKRVGGGVDNPETIKVLRMAAA